MPSHEQAPNIAVSRNGLSLGIACLWLWAICLFPSAGVPSPLHAFEEFGSPSWPIALAVGTGLNLLVALFPKKLDSSRALISMVVLGCMCQVIAITLADNSTEIPHQATVAGIFTGLSIGVLWIPWTWRLVHIDVEHVEVIFVRTLFFVAVGFSLVLLLPTWMKSAVMYVLPSAQLGLYMLSGSTKQRKPNNDGVSPPRSAACTPSPTQQVGAMQESSQNKGFIAKTSARCLFAYALISLTGETIHSAGTSTTVEPLWLFAAGLFIAGLVLRLFTVHSDRVDIFGAVRWIFPVVALGAVWGTGESEVLASFGVILLALGHAAFEGMLRMDLIALAQRSTVHQLRIVSLGLAIISIGAGTGILMFGALASSGIGNDRVLLYTFVILIWMVLLFFSKTARPELKHPAPLQSEDVCSLVAAQFGLTPRETEVLGYLIEGRSHPFIRDELCISKGTVDTHVRHIYSKMEVSSKQELISAVKDVRSALASDQNQTGSSL